MVIIDIMIIVTTIIPLTTNVVKFQMMYIDQTTFAIPPISSRSPHD